MTARLFPALLALFLLLPDRVAADDAAARGLAVIDQWCRLCHLRKDDPPDPVMAPPYEKIVMRPGRNRAYFETFMREDHFPMTTFRLFDQEKADVVAYLMALQAAQPRSRN